VGNIKILNDFKNNIEDKINSLKKKLILNNNHISVHFLKINYEKFLNLNPNHFLLIFSYFETHDLFHIINISGEIKSRIIEIIKQYSNYIIGEFERKYLRMFKLDKKFLIFKKSKKNKRGHLKINLVLKSKIISESLKDKSITIGYKCKYPCDKESLRNVFKFDVRSPGPLSFWIMREYTNVSFK
jgi:hypothetical protein